MVAASNRNGTRAAKAAFEDTSSSPDPIAPPIMVSPVSRATSRRSMRATSRRNPRAAARYPGRAATVVVALADTSGTPVKTSAGKVMNVPPPATAFSMPPKNPAASNNRNSATSRPLRHRATLRGRPAKGNRPRPDFHQAESVPAGLRP